MIPTPACPACNATQRRPYHQHGQWELYLCAGCGLIYLDPMPDAATLASMYHNAYDDASTGYFSKPESKLRRSSTRIRIIKRLGGFSGGNFLDVGCNGGFMVEAARRGGFQAWGVEPDPVSVEYARTHYPANNYFNGLIADFDPKDSNGAPVKFNAAYCCEVIEHVPQPQEFLRAIHRLLEPGAILYLTTPDISHWRRPRDLERWDGFCPPSHCLYFTPSSLTALAQRCGFELIQRRPAWKPGIKLVLRRSV